jgi:hypothetical protein
MYDQNLLQRTTAASCQADSLELWFGRLAIPAVPYVTYLQQPY